MTVCAVFLHRSTVDDAFFCAYVRFMNEQQAAILALRERAYLARVPMYQVCEEAKVAPSTLTRWRDDPSKAKQTTLTRLANALDRIEERASQ